MKKILEILSRLHPEYNFNVECDSIEFGLFDSFDIVTLIFELEDEFDINIDVLDIIPENFCSKKSIANLVRKNGGLI